MLTSSTEKQVIQIENAEENLHYVGVWDVDPRDLSKVTSQVCLIDVREPDEFTGELGHIPGAKLIPLGVLDAHLNEIPKDKTVVFVCRSGGRSARAAAHALENGYKSIYNLKGGMLLWTELHLPAEA